MPYPYTNPYAYTSQPWAAPMQPVQPTGGLIKVTGIDGARAYQLPPNSTAALFDGEDDVFYLKTTDAGGYPTIREFRFEEVAQTGQAQPGAVTREEFAELAAKVERLMEATPNG